MTAQPASTTREVTPIPEIAQPAAGGDHVMTHVAASTYTAAGSKEYLDAVKAPTESKSAGLPDLELSDNISSSTKTAAATTEKSTTNITEAPAAASGSENSNDIKLSSTVQGIVDSMGLKGNYTGPAIDNLTGFSGAGTTAKPMSEYGSPDGKGGFTIDNDPSGYGGDLAPKTSVTGTQLFVADVKFDPNAIKPATFDGGTMHSWPAVWGLSADNKSNTLEQEVDTMEYFGKANDPKPAGSTLHDWIPTDHAASKSYSAAIDPSLFDNAATSGVEVAALVDKNNDTVTTYINGEKTEEFQLKAGDPALTTPMSWILGTGDGEKMDVTNVQMYTPDGTVSNPNPNPNPPPNPTPNPGEGTAVLKRAASLNSEVGEDRGDLNNNYSQLYYTGNSIIQQEKTDAAANGGKITDAQYTQLNTEENQLSSNIAKDNYGAGNAEFQASHPDRSAILGEDQTLLNELNQDDGHLNGHFEQLLYQDNSIRQEEQADAIAGNGAISGQQYNKLNAEEMTLASQIKQDV